jgi:hypothetical protein
MMVLGCGGRMSNRLPAIALSVEQEGIAREDVQALNRPKEFEVLAKSRLLCAARKSETVSGICEAKKESGWWGGWI